MKYTESEKRALYESIMLDVAKTVKRHLNESYKSSIVQKLVQMAKNISRKDKDRCYVLMAVNEHAECIIGDSRFCNGETEWIGRIKLGDFTDDCFDGEILTGADAEELYNQVNHRTTPGVGAIYLKKIGGDYGVPFAIRLSETGLERCVEIRDKARERRRNKENEPVYKSTKERLDDFKFEKRFSDDCRKARKYGLSNEEYFSLLMLLDTDWPGEFNNVMSWRYHQMLSNHGVQAGLSKAKKALMKILSVTNEEKG